ncbi:phage minor tail protein L [Bordetella hinzii]|uniref:phage minor tail protein L n=1 Tax=Bordetella hinzii TaxID=103855 RepID=UPI000459E3ED|nr:phage minor tail protein L [Bordetella hinzii]KCB48658.1 phage minor tail protein L [Bordetella hinzii 4161]KXA71685.1 phage tail protein [Bordetella hinzii LMG 13501]QDJ37928.1 phage minor tail protein L [Bordetella hinzii]VEH25049.1 phage minor tail protein L [Bordetella hinzii]
MGVTADIQKLEPGVLVRLFELDCSRIGGDVLHFHGYPQAGSLFWKGVEYRPWAIEARDFERTGDARQPAPTLAVGNIGETESGQRTGVISSLCLALDDLVGATLTVRETLGQYLDPANFAGGNPSADPSQELPTEVWIVEQKTSETPEVVEFELSNALSFDGRKLPGRQITASICHWLWIGGYRGPYCGYSHNAYFDAQNTPTRDPALDRCPGLVSACQLRFGAQQGVLPVEAVINFGGAPSADRIR